MIKQETRSLAIRLGGLTFARLIINTALRFVYPFAPAMARGLGVNREDIYYLITFRNMVGFLSPIFGPISEKFGRKAVLIGSMVLFGIGCLLVFIWPVYLVLGLTLIIIGLAKIIYDPAMQAYVGDTVPYKQRGRALSITEYSWALSLLIGAPLVGVLIRLRGWQSPFVWLGIFAVAAALLLAYALPRKEPTTALRPSYKSSFSVLFKQPVVLIAALYTMLVMVANEMLFIVFGGWMEDSFQLTLTSLGIAAGIIGGAELIGETLAGWAVDRFGKRPVIILSGLLNAICYFFLPYLSFGLVPVLVALFFLFLTFEVTVVGGMPLMTELVPSSRAVVMSVLIAAMMMGRTLGAFLGPLVWDRIGLYGSSVIWSGIMLTAVLILALGIREGKESVLS